MNYFFRTMLQKQFQLSNRQTKVVYVSFYIGLAYISFQVNVLSAYVAIEDH